MFGHDNMVINANRAEVLKVLIDNRAKHIEMVKEARAGYLQKAQETLKERLAQIEAGRVVDLKFNLPLPQDHTSVYNTTILMLEMHQGDTIEMNSEQIRNFMFDQWDWSMGFLVSNSAYSQRVGTALANAMPDGVEG